MKNQPKIIDERVNSGGVSEAVNFATEDFYKAATILKRITNNFATKFEDLKPGMQHFVQMQFFRMNSAGQILDVLGYQSVTNILSLQLQPAVKYIEATMVAWNKTITEEGEVEKLWATMGEEEAA